MKHSVFVTALIVLVLGCGAVWAADPAATTYNWTGFYAGLNTGVAKNNSRYSVVSNEHGFPFSGSFDNPAFTVGGQAGYNYQVGNFVYGLETDINYEGPSPQLDYFGTLRGRLGYTPADRLLFYVTGGLAYGYVSSTTTIHYEDFAIFSGSSSGMQVGWTVGVGGEFALTNNWSVKLEYLYVDLGSMSYSFYPGAVGAPAPTFSNITTTINTLQNVIRVGLNYKF
jgi:outer membrane immunogenic protein